MRKLFASLTVGILLAASPAAAKDTYHQYIKSLELDGQSVTAKNGVVSAQDAIAAQVGRHILARGGNAVDAAVATGFALAVTHPQAGNIGGGGFMMISLEDQDKVIALDFREMAPLAADRDMFLGPDGEVDNRLAWSSHLSAGTPGTVMGLLEALETYGTMSRRQVIGPAVRLADRGFPVSQSLHDSLENHRDRLEHDASSIEYFYQPDGRLHEVGSILVQDDLASTLRRIMDDGADGFYKGETAYLIKREMEAGNGIITQADLDAYTVVTRDAVTGSFNGYDISAMPPPSSGGVHIIQMLNILSALGIEGDDVQSADYMHKMIEAMRRAYADRSKYLGDPDYFDVPIEALTDQTYADYLAGTIDPTQASRSEDIAPAEQLPYESPQTTHYSVIDKHGNAVAVTYTLNFSYGSGYTVDGAGFLLNNEMDDFSSKPGSPNGYGLIGGVANQIEPGKRPLSSMSPAIVHKDGEVVLVTGSIGGSRIITATLQIILNVIQHGMTVSEAVNAPRFHHQWLPDEVIVEPGFPEDTLNVLSERGFTFDRDDSGQIVTEEFGRANSVASDGDYVYGASDPRDSKSAAAGH